MGEVSYGFKVRMSNQDFTYCLYREVNVALTIIICYLQKFNQLKLENVYYTYKACASNSIHKIIKGENGIVEISLKFAKANVVSIEL